MRIVIIEFMSLDGVVQAPGGPDEDTDGGFAHGGWTHPFRAGLHGLQRRGRERVYLPGGRRGVGRGSAAVCSAGRTG